MDDANEAWEEGDRPFIVSEFHLKIIKERLREREANPNRGEPWEIVRKRLGWDEE